MVPLLFRSPLAIRYPLRLPQFFLNDRPQRILDEGSNQLGRRVMGSGRAPFPPGNDQFKAGGDDRCVQVGMEFQKTLVDRPQLFDVEGGVVHTSWLRGPVFAIPGQMPEGFE